MSELNQSHVVVGALQESRWFGHEVYHVGESVVPTAGRDVPGKVRVLLLYCQVRQ